MSQVLYSIAATTVMFSVAGSALGLITLYGAGTLGKIMTRVEPSYNRAWALVFRHVPLAWLVIGALTSGAAVACALLAENRTIGIVACAIGCFGVLLCMLNHFVAHGFYRTFKAKETITNSP
ncbi:MAG: hypothetical protein WBK28_01055 [Minisyncoccia bacterium]